MNTFSPQISVVTPTLNEAENIPHLVAVVDSALSPKELSWELLVVDDSSPDGTADVAEALAAEFPVRVIRRTGRKPGLSASVMDGIREAHGDVVVVMDADLSHPAITIPLMYESIQRQGCDAAVASRYIEGGGATNWPWYRKLLSRLGGLLARGLVDLSDPMTGFMAVKRSLAANLRFEPIGWKIVLDILARSGARFIEVPIVFNDRLYGRSKLSIRVQFDYLRQILSLYLARLPSVREFVLFCAVGLSGVVVDSVVLIATVELFGLSPTSAAPLAFLAAVSWNYSQ